MGTARTIASRGEVRAPLASLTPSLVAPSLDGECLSGSSESITSRMRYGSVKRGCPTKLGKKNFFVGERAASEARRSC